MASTVLPTRQRIVLHWTTTATLSLSTYAVVAFPNTPYTPTASRQVLWITILPKAGRYHQTSPSERSVHRDQILSQAQSSPFSTSLQSLQVKTLSTSALSCWNAPGRIR